MNEKSNSVNNNGLKVQGITKRFGDLTAVENVSFTAQKGEVVGVLGPNGAGKSTTMRIITGYLEPCAGSVHIDGFDVVKNPILAKQKVGYVPEGAPAYTDMTVMSFLEFIAALRGFTGAVKSLKIDEVVSKMALKSVLHQVIDTLSKGYRRRVSLAQALLHDPNILILDEPTDGLDPNQKHEVRNLITAMAANKIIILSTHILEEVEAICNRVIVIAAGKVVADSTPQALAARSSVHNALDITLKPTDQDVIAILEDIRDIKKVDLLVRTNNELSLRVHPATENCPITEISNVIMRHGWEIIDFHKLKGKMDEVFRKLTAPFQKVS